MPSPLPDYLAKLVQESPANRDKLLAAWDGFTTESRIQILDHLIESGAVPLMAVPVARRALARSEEHTSELQSLMRISYAVFCLKQKNITPNTIQRPSTQ